MNLGFSSGSISGALQEHFDRLSRSFRESMEVLISDPLMKCFSESTESQKYMFDRIEEIISDSVIQISSSIKLPPSSIQSDPGRGGSGNAGGSQVFEMQKIICGLEEKNKKMMENVSGDRERMDNLMQDLDKEKRERKNIEARFEQMDEERKTAQDKVADLEDILAIVKAKVHPLENQVEEKSRENERLGMKVADLEQQVRKLEFNLKEGTDQMIRENRQLVEENDLMNKKCKDLQKLTSGGNSTKSADTGSKLQVLEETIRQLKDSNDALSRRADEMEFAKRNIEDHMVTLKTEITDTNEMNTQLKRQKHGLEIELIELSNKLAEITIKANRQKEEVEKTNVDSEYLKSEFDKLEKLYKTEKRKSSNMERELDQIKYSHDMLHKNTNEEIKSLRDHNSGLKNENKGLQEKLEVQFKEMQQRLEEERKNNIKGIKRIKELENEEETLLLQVESLNQKVEFYKHQLQTNNNANNYSDGLDRKSQSLQDSVRDGDHRGYRNNFESFSSFHKVKEISLGIKDDRDSSACRMDTGSKFDYKRTGGFRDYRLENSALRNKLSTLQIQVTHLREVLRMENANLRQELTLVKNALFKGLEILSTRVRMNVRRFNADKAISQYGEKVGGKSYLSPSGKYQNFEQREIRQSSSMKRRLNNFDNSSLRVGRFLCAEDRSKTRASSPKIESPLTRHKYGYDNMGMLSKDSSSSLIKHQSDNYNDIHKENLPYSDNKRRSSELGCVSSIMSQKDINIHTIEQESNDIMQRLNLRRNRHVGSNNNQYPTERADRYSYIGTPLAERSSRHHQY